MQHYVIYKASYYIVGFPKCVGDKKYKYSNDEVHFEHEGINLYGRFLLPKCEGNFSTWINAHGAESDYKSNITTLKSLAMSGISIYTFDFYGWSKRTKGPKSGDWFKKIKKGDNTYENQVLEQPKDLNAVISKGNTFEHVYVNNIFVITSSMGRVTTAVSSIIHSNDVKGLISPQAEVDRADLDVNKYIKDKLLKKQLVVPLILEEHGVQKSQAAHYI